MVLELSLIFKTTKLSVETLMFKFSKRMEGIQLASGVRLRPEYFGGLVYDTRNGNTLEVDKGAFQFLNLIKIVVDAYDEGERAMGWYYYLEDRLSFPFKARCMRQELKSPLKKKGCCQSDGHGSRERM